MHFSLLEKYYIQSLESGYWESVTLIGPDPGQHCLPVWDGQTGAEDKGPGGKAGLCCAFASPVYTCTEGTGQAHSLTEL